MADQNLRDQILAQLDAWATSDDPDDWVTANAAMYDALRAIVVGPDPDNTDPTYLPQPWAYQTIAAALRIDTGKDANHG